MSDNKHRDVYYTVGNSPFVYIGYNCNNRCVFCFESGREFPQKTTEEIKKEVDVIRENFDFINFMGQEPTLRDDLPELLNYAKEKQFRWYGITTNGRMLAYPNYAKKILDTELTQIGITVVGCDSKTHDSHTLAKGSFEQTLMGIKNIQRFKKHDLSVLLNIMVTQNNYEQLLKIVDFYAALEIVEINIGHIMPLNKVIRNSKKIIAKMSDVAPFLMQINDKYADRIKFLFVEYPACLFPKKYRDLAFPCLEENPEKKRIHLCKKCDFKDKCVGISKYYINLYGTDEFSL
jgi:MoaA/NifB/PqqE/SkfB family radical SAM enzyme